MFKFKKHYAVLAVIFVCLFGLFKTSPGKCGVAITDTDGGVNYFQKGQTYTGAYFRDTTDAYTDTCTTGNYLMEYYVTDNEIKYDPYECPNGCKDGACILEPKRGQKIGDVDGDGKITKTDSDIVAKIDAGLIFKPTDICAVDADQNKKVDTFDALAISEIVAGKKTSPGNCGSPVITSGSSAKFIKGNAYTIAFKITNANLDSKLIYRLNDPNGSSAENATFDKTNTASSRFYLDQNNVLTFLMSFYPKSSWTAGEYKAVFDVETNGVKLRANEIKLEILNPLPDLAIDDIYSDNGKLSVKIKNIGAAEAPANKGHLYIYIDDQLKWTYSLSALSDQKFRSIGGSSVIQPQTLTGSHTIKAEIDPKFEIAESNEDNNTLAKTVSFGETTKPDLTVADIVASPNMVQNENGYLSVRIKNLGGDLTSGKGLLNWYNNFAEQKFIFANTTTGILSFTKNRDLPTLDNPLKTNEIITFSWYGNFNTSGNLYLHFTVDNGRELDEIDENNNTLTKTITVGKENFVCSDSDGGKDYAKKGNAVYSDSNIEGRVDCCKNLYSANMGDAVKHIGTGGGACVSEGKYLYEAVCGSDNIPTTTVYECPNGCKDGACAATGKDETYYSTNLKTDRKLYQAPEKIILELWSYSKNPNVDSDTYFVDIWLFKILKQGTIEKELIESAFKVSTRGFSSFKEINITSNDYFNKNGSGEYAFTVCKVNACTEMIDGKLVFNSNSGLDNIFTVIMPAVSELIFSNIQVPTSSIRPTEATVTWETNYPSNSDVHYWSANNIHEENWNWDKIDDYTQKSHSIRLKDLKPFTTYQVTVSGQREAGVAKTTSAEEISFTTAVKDTSIDKINNAAKNLNDNKFDQILEEIKTLKDVIKEQQAQIKYLTKLTQGVKELSEKATDAINNFITYGVDENTKRLGAGERAAVMYSYKAAFDKLPESETEFADAIKIANGRWPSITNQNAENRAKEQFQKVYKRTPGMNNARDNAAVTIMSYGLRQRAENRNMNSERAGIAIFKSIYNKLPQTTEEWNIMQAITYSGAAR